MTLAAGLAVVVGAGAVSLTLADPAADVAPPVPEATAGYAAQRCQMLGHDRRRLETEAQRLADEELAPIFRRMDDRVDDFAEWAFRWRTSYALLRRSGLGAVAAMVKGESVPDRLRAERDDFVEEAFHDAIVKDEDRALRGAAMRWRDRLRRASDEMDREHDTALALYLGFRPRLGVARALGDLPPAVSAPGASGEAKTFAITRLARPMLVRFSARLAAAFVPASLTAEALGGSTIVPLAPVSIAALLGTDFVISRLDAWRSRDAFAAELRLALGEARVRLRDSWVGAGRAEITRRVLQRREMLSAVAGPGQCGEVL